MIGPVLTQKMRSYSIIEFSLQNLKNTFAAGIIFDREQKLDSSVKIAGHPVSRRKIYVLMAFIAEVENSGMFEKSSCYGANRNILRHTRYSGSETAYSPYDKINLHSGTGSVVKLPDNILIYKRINLRDDARGLPCLGVGSFTGNLPQKIILHPKRSRNKSSPRLRYR